MGKDGFKFKAGNVKKYINGYSEGGTSKNIVMLLSAKNETPAHEIFHGLKLPHTWQSKNHKKAGEIDLTVPNGKHSFEYCKTYNIMDYSDTRYFIYDCQAKIANNNATAEPNNYIPAL